MRKPGWFLPRKRKFRQIPRSGDSKGKAPRKNPAVWRLLGGVSRMLQWKPKLIALVVVLVLIAALLGQFTWESFADQFTW